MPLHPTLETATATPVAAAAALAAVAATAMKTAIEPAVPLVTVPLNCAREKCIGYRSGTI